MLREIACYFLALLACTGAEAATFTYTALNQGEGYGTLTSATGINDQGEIVGYVDDYEFLGVTTPFVIKNGVTTTIGEWLVPGEINDTGQVAGALQTHPMGIQAAVVYNTNTNSFAKLNVFGSDNAAATGINNAGHVVGYYATAANRIASFLDINGKLTSFSVPGATRTYAEDINNLGQVVGNSFDAAGNSTSFLYFNGQFTTITDPGDPSDHLYVTGINDKGEIIGNATGGFIGSNASGGFVDDNGTFTTISFPGFLYTAVEGINDEGQIVGGFASEYDEVSDAFLATPIATPEPQSLLLSALTALTFLLPAIRRQFL